MLTMAYCRVSTEEQAEEGFSMEGQADRLRSYAQLRDLGEVTVVEDPGLSGKDMGRPGLQRLLQAVRAGHVAHVLVWRLDRLSRNLGDLVLLADTFGVHGVSLHSVQENLDLSSAAGRMFYNILGAFAQFFREQLAENVKMGNERAVREGRHINRPKTGYSLVDGLLVPNQDAERVREVFRLRAGGMGLRDIEGRTGLKFSTVGSILQSRVYLGEVPHNGQWFPGRHEPLVTPEEFAAANRGFVPGRRRGRDLLSGRVRCGLCGKRMPVDQNGEGRVLYRCRHRGQGCRQPARTNLGLARAAVLGLALIGGDERLREAIRRQLSYGQAGDPAKAGARRPRRRPAAALKALSEQRRKLLELYYEDGISKELFSEEEQRLTRHRGRPRTGWRGGAPGEPPFGAGRSLRAGCKGASGARRPGGLGGSRGRRAAGTGRGAGGRGNRVPGPPRSDCCRRPTAQRAVQRSWAKGVGDRACRRGDLNPHGLAPTSTSSSPEPSGALAP